jgi:hypothetical protein
MNLESIVLSLSDSQALVEHGIVLDTALVWEKDAWGLHVLPNGDPVNRSFTLCPAPILSELLDAIGPAGPSTEKMAALAHALIALREEVSK